MSLQITHRITEDQFEQLSSFYFDTWWTSYRTKQELQDGIEHSSINFFAIEGDRLIGIARVLTDDQFKAFILDVVVDPAYQNKGVGTFIMTSIEESPRLANVDHIELFCKGEMIPYYNKLGFDVIPADIYALRKDQKKARD